MSSLVVLADHLLVCQSLSYHHIPMLAMALDKEDYFVCLLAVTLFSATMRVLSLSLPIPHSMCFLWVVCHPSKTFPPKEPEQEPHNRFSPFPTARPCPLTSDPWPHYLLYWLSIGWWCLGLVHVSISYTSKICLLLTRSPWSRGMFAYSDAHPQLLMVWAIFWLLIL